LTPRPPARLAAAAAVLAGAWLCAALTRALPVVRDGRALAAAQNLDVGHALLTAVHGPGVDPTWRMPIGVLLETGMILASPRAGTMVVAAVVGLDVLMTGALAALLGGPAAGLAAAAGWLWLLAETPRNPGSIKMMLYAFFVLLAAFGLALRARAPSPRADLSAGASLAAGFLMRSVLLPLAPLTALWSLLRGKPRSAALLLLPTVLLLAPWAQVNRRIHGTWTAVEHGVTDQIIVAGIIGLNDTSPEGNFRVLAPDLAKGDSVAVWAIRRVAAHPLDFLSLAAARLLYAAGLKPLLLAMAILGTCLRRRDPAARAAALVAGAYLAAHVAVATVAYEYDPLWPLLCALAAAPLAALEEGALSTRGAPLAGFSAGLAAALAAALTADAVALRYEYRVARRAPGSSEALAEALASRPDDPLLLLERGRERIAAGDAAGALPVLLSAERRLPDLARIPVERARAQELAGRRGALAREAAVLPAVSRFDDDVALRLRLYEADAAVRRNSEIEAAAAVSAAAEAWRASQRLTVARDTRERELEARLKDGAGENLSYHAEYIFDREPEERWAPGLAAAAVSVEPDVARGLALRLQADGRGDLACPLLGKLAAAPAASARAWSDFGVCSFINGHRAAAIAALERAHRADPASAEYAASLAAAQHPAR
jgi:hypothetical protein